MFWLNLPDLRQTYFLIPHDVFYLFRKFRHFCPWNHLNHTKDLCAQTLTI